MFVVKEGVDRVARVVDNIRGYSGVSDYLRGNAYTISPQTQIELTSTTEERLIGDFLLPHMEVIIPYYHTKGTNKRIRRVIDTWVGTNEVRRDELLIGLCTFQPDRVTSEDSLVQMDRNLARLLTSIYSFEELLDGITWIRSESHPSAMERLGLSIRERVLHYRYGWPIHEIDTYGIPIVQEKTPGRTILTRAIMPILEDDQVSNSAKRYLAETVMRLTPDKLEDQIPIAVLWYALGEAYDHNRAAHLLRKYSRAVNFILDKIQIMPLDRDHYHFWYHISHNIVGQEGTTFYFKPLLDRLLTDGSSDTRTSGTISYGLNAILETSGDRDSQKQLVSPDQATAIMDRVVGLYADLVEDIDEWLPRTEMAGLMRTIVACYPDVLNEDRSQKLRAALNRLEDPTDVEAAWPLIELLSPADMERLSQIHAESDSNDHDPI